MAVSLQEGAPFRMLGVRQFQTAPGVAASFPLGYPLLLAASELVLPIGPRVGVLVNVLLVLGAAGIGERAGRRSGLVGLGPAVVLAVAIWPPFAQEIVAARSFPLAMLVIFGLIATLVNQESDYRWVLAGMLVGVAGTVRFDLLPVSGLAVALFWWLEGDRQWQKLVAAVAFAAAIFSAYTFTGVIATGEFIRSDNMRTVVAATDVYVLDLLQNRPATLFDNPVGWVSRLASNVEIVAKSLVLAAASGLPSVATVILLAPSDARIDRNLFRCSAAIGVATFIGTTFSVLATGYSDLRYWTLTVASVTLIVSLKSAEAWLRRAASDYRRILVVAATGLLILHGSWFLLGETFLGEHSSIREPLAGAGRCLAPDDRVIWEDPRQALYISAMARVQTSVLPSNFDELTLEEQEGLVTDFGVTHFRDNSQITTHLKLPTQPTDCLGIVEIASTADE